MGNIRLAAIDLSPLEKLHLAVLPDTLIHGLTGKYVRAGPAYKAALASRLVELKHEVIAECTTGAALDQIRVALNAHTPPPEQTIYEPHPEGARNARGF